MALYDRIGVGYDSTRCADPYILSRLIHHLKPAPDKVYLDVGCGSGNYTAAMRDAGIELVGLDISPVMLDAARDKTRGMRLVNASADAIPFRDASFAGATATFTHHHFSDPVAAFGEVRRVLARGARFVVFNGTAEQLRHEWVCEYFPRAMADAIAPYQRCETVEALDRAGFAILGEEPYEVALDLKDWFLYCGKHNPERYFDPRVRAGISFFANAADQSEFNRGLERLARDLESGEFERVRARYSWDGGDYTFTIAQK